MLDRLDFIEVTSWIQTPCARRSRGRKSSSTKQRYQAFPRAIGDVPAATAILDRFLHHAEIIAITGKSYRLKDQACRADKENV